MRVLKTIYEFIAGEIRSLFADDVPSLVRFESTHEALVSQRDELFDEMDAYNAALVADIDELEEEREALENLRNEMEGA